MKSTLVHKVVIDSCILRYDCSSRTYGVGKELVFEKFLKGDLVLNSCANEFISPHKNSADVVNLGK